MTPHKPRYRTRPFKDLTGKIFSRLTVIKVVGHNKRGARVWLCQCECGNENTACASDLKSGNTKSCGCLHREIESAPRPHRRRNGPLYIGFGIYARNRLIDGYTRRCKRNGITWGLTTEQAEVLFKGNCHYCGAEPSQIRKPRGCFTGEYIYNGIDRVDNSRGYVLENVVSCCKTCNRAKLVSSYEDFVTWIKRAYTYLEQTGRITAPPR